MKIGKHLIIATVCGLFMSALWAEPTIEAKISSSQISINDSLTLEIDITGLDNVPNPGQIDIPNFTVQSAGRTKSIQFINGKTTSKTTFRYVLSPTKTGNLSIPGISLNSEGKVFNTKPLGVVVTPASTQAQGSPQTQTPSNPQRSVQVPQEGIKSVFMTAEINKSKAYVGEQILLTVKFLRRPMIRLASQPRYSEPDITGFLVEPLKQQEYTTTINGAQYLVTELRYALFPTSDGNFAIGSASIDLAVHSNVDPFNANSIFENFFGRTKMVRLNTQAIPIRVRALPKNKPTEFSGAVGRYKMSAQTDAAEPEVGKPFNLLVKIEGIGNIKSLKEPKFPDLSAFRKYETISETKVDNSGKLLNGEKRFKILMIPQVSGEISVPELKYTYFNPDLSQYVTINTREINLNVKAGTLNPTDQTLYTQKQPGQVTEGIRVVEKDIRFLKQGKIRSLTAPVFLQTPFLMINGLPPIFALGAFLVGIRSRHREKFASDYRSRGALSHAQKILKKAKKNITHPDPNIFYGPLSHALFTYLGDKFGISSQGMVWEDLNYRLEEREVSQDLRKVLRHLLTEADMARFATSSFDDAVREKSLFNAEKLLTELNKIL